MNTMQRVVRNGSVLILLFFISSTGFGQVIPDHQVRTVIDDIQNPLQRLLTLEPKIYQYNTSQWKDIRLPGGNHYGFMPEHVEKVFPDLVNYQNHSYSAGKNMFRTAKIKTVDSESLIPILVASIKEQQEELAKLRKEIELLRKDGLSANF